MNDRLAKLRHIVFDMDGTIYLGRTLFKETIPFLALLREFGVGYTFVTNNSSKSRAGYVRHLHEMGINAPPDAVVTSAWASSASVRSEMRRSLPFFSLPFLALPSLAWTTTVLVAAS